MIRPKIPISITDGAMVREELSFLMYPFISQPHSNGMNSVKVLRNLFVYIIITFLFNQFLALKLSILLASVFPENRIVIKLFF
jgi:hypothetical protein